MSNVVAPPRESTSSNVAWSVNQDACTFCGMSGLEMLQKGELKNHICDEKRAIEHRGSTAWALWRWYAEEMR